MKIQSHYVDLQSKSIYPAELIWQDGRIQALKKIPSAPDTFLLPGFIDAHIHIESSMLVPSEFARLATPHGTIATVSDPHEIANVLGVAGVDFMINNAAQVPLKFFFGAPSCVPATEFETAGASISPTQIRQLLSRPEILYLAEMMNFPGVIHHDEMVWEKLNIAKELGKPIDGHAPGLRGTEAAKYIAAGISTDHECVSREEAEEKIRLGMKVIIREGSAARNFDALIDLLPLYPYQIMFCSDDKHPDELILGHINQIVARAISRGFDLFDVLQAACLNPIHHYQLPVGKLQPGDPADFILVQDLSDFKVLQTYIEGDLVAENGRSNFSGVPVQCPNQFAITPSQAEDFRIPAKTGNIRAIEVMDGALITKEKLITIPLRDGFAMSDPKQDVLKICVLNRYHPAKPAMGFITNMGLKTGAIASSVGHDSHNIIAVGVDDQSLSRAVNLIIAHQGGISAVWAEQEKVLPLPVAGIMSDQAGVKVGEAYQALDQMAKAMGSQLRAPFMSLSFMALLVIPALKLSDLGLFDGAKFGFTDLFWDDQE